MTDIQNDLIPVTDKERLEEIASAEILRFIPTLVLLTVIFAFGSIGNGMVFYIYKTRYQTSNTRMFILFLSSLDFFICSIAVPVHTVTIPDQYRLYTPVLCKGSAFLDAIGTVTTSFILVSIAFERYKKICKPFSQQMTLSMVRRRCIVSTVVGVIIAIPSLFVYGRTTLNLKRYPLSLIECSTDDAVKDSLLPVLNSCVYGLVFLVTVVSVAVFYTFSASAIYKQAGKMYEISVRVRGHSRSQSDVRSLGTRSSAIGSMSTITRNWSLRSIRDREGTYLYKVKFGKKPNSKGPGVDKENDKATINIPAKVERSEYIGANDPGTIIVTNKTSQLPDGEADTRQKDSCYLSEEEPTCSTYNSTDKIITESSKENKHSVENNKNEGWKPLPNSTENRIDESREPVRKSNVDDNCYEGRKETRNPNHVKMNVNRKASGISLPFSTTQYLDPGSAQTGDDNIAMRKVSPIPGHSRHILQTAGRRSVITMLVVSLTFIACYIPVITLLFIRSYDKEFVTNLSNTQYILYRFALRSYFLNFAANPIIYGICDFKFRQITRELFSDCLSKCRSGEED